MSYVMSGLGALGLGDAASDYQACLTSKKAYEEALKKYQAWSALLGSTQASYAMAIASLQQKWPNVSYPATAPRCISATDHQKYSNICYVQSNPIKGLGLTQAEAAAQAAAQAAAAAAAAQYGFDLSKYPPCFVAALPVCQTLPAKPTVPTNPGDCSAQAAAAAAQAAATAAAKSAPAPVIAPAPVTPVVTTVPVPVAVPVPQPAPTPAPQNAAPIVEASVTSDKGVSGWLVVAAIGAAGLGYMLFRKKKPA